MPAPTTPVDSRLHGDIPERSPDAVVETLATDATVLVSGFGMVGYPKAVPEAVAASDRSFDLTVVSGGSVGPEIDVDLVEADAVARRFPYQAQPQARDAVNDARIAFQDRNVSTLGDEVCYRQLATPDVAVVEAVAVGEDWLIPSTSIGHTPAFVEAADRVVVEVNEAQPLALQQLHDAYRVSHLPRREPVPLTDPDERISTPYVLFDADSLAAVVRTDRRDSPYTFREPTDRDRQIADNLAGFLADEVDRTRVFDDAIQLQFGVGGLGNALMQAVGDLDVGDRDVVYFGEVIQDGLLDMLDAGTVECASATSLALSAAAQDRLFAAVDRYASDVVLRPADVSNNPAVISRMGVVAVNSAVEIDLYGHVNSTHVGGTHLLNGIGGSGDFNRNAFLSVVAMASVAKEGAVSRIVPLTPHVDHTEHDIDVVVTEQGVADLRGLDPRERAETIVEQCAHPDHRADLNAYRKDASRTGGHIPHDLPRALSWHSPDDA